MDGSNVALCLSFHHDVYVTTQGMVGKNYKEKHVVVCTVKSKWMQLDILLFLAYMGRVVSISGLLYIKAVCDLDDRVHHCTVCSIRGSGNASSVFIYIVSMARILPGTRIKSFVILLYFLVNWLIFMHHSVFLSSFSKLEDLQK